MNGVRKVVMSAGVLLLAAVGGCAANGQVRSLGAASGSTAVGASASPTPSTVIFPQATLLGWARSALLGPTSLGVVGNPTMKKDEEVDYYPTSYCGKDFDDDQGTHAAVERTWESDDIYVYQESHAFAGRGVEILKQIRAAATGCKSAYTNSNGGTETIVSILDFTSTPGIEDTYGVCIEYKKANDKTSYYSCTAYLARGHMLVEVGLNYAGNTKDNSKRIKQVVPLAATLLLTVN